MKTFKALILVLVGVMLLSIAGFRSSLVFPSASADEVDATADPVSGILTIHAIDIPNAAGGVNVFEARLQLVNIPLLTFELISASPSSRIPGNNATGDPGTGVINIPRVALGANLYSVTMSLVPASNPLAFRITSFAQVPKPPCATIAGLWSGSEQVTATCTILGESETETISGQASINIQQNGCNVSWKIPGTNFTRSGTVEGNTIRVVGPFLVPLEGDVHLTQNTFTAEGTVSGNSMMFTGSGLVKGTFEGINFSCTGNSTATLTRSNLRLRSRERGSDLLFLDKALKLSPLILP